ncbi:MAG TPA: hypothetical protein VNZ44_06185 [Pyrinomonadaceae bacterium]|nr:hypothetical protein [Pyrinomonadaceae bacterium]
MTMGAQVVDITPAAFRRSLDRGQVTAEVEQAVTVLDDCADGILALDFALSFAGFGYEARQLVLSVVGLLGGGGATLEAFDGELAKHVQCSERTVRRWRAAHLKESKARRFSLLEVVEGEYDAAKKCYGKTSYRFTAPDYVDVVVREARASDLYERDRRTAIEQAAEEHYADIPDAPPRRRSRKPQRAPSVRVEQAFVNAARSVEKGKLALRDLGEDSREALLESPQGEEMRRLLLKLQSDVAEILENFPQPTEGEELKGGIGQNVRYPLLCPVPSHETRDEPSAEDVAAWEEVERRAAGEPQVLTREVQLRPPPSDEELEAAAIRAEGCKEL